ncbi:hypothetical protein [Martelella mediterranea]|uniref:MazG-like nucleotide pyrophosphohydrolase family protein n=1 Tax=Martelella mediterranea TaxID=293089 RepID=A0A4R3NUM1_9HYPH|nr:hypothetical protein [Martelella mediterranea]TCT41178.1 hypothetical protein EDC90_1007155 [Martelella mediterranea]
MSEHYNRLSPAEAERLAMLAEEAGEIVQAVGKILRHGYESFHPSDPTTPNRVLLSNEVGDLSAVYTMMLANGDLPSIQEDEVTASLASKLRCTHHQRAECER